jgi:3-deoxy-D-manno-octulosonic-acid transferase
LLWLVLPVATAAVAWRGLRDRQYWRGWSQRFGFGTAATTPVVWFHAVSVGEVQAAVGLVGMLHHALPAVPLLLTSATPTGRERATQARGEMAMVRYAPYDLPGMLRRLLRATRPRLLIVLETELWPNLLHQCALGRIPVLLVNARISPRTLHAYLRWRGLLSRRALQNLRVAAQSSADASRFAALGVPESAIRITGNLKFDRQVEPAVAQRGAQWRERLAAGRPVWVAGSTHEGEERAVLEAHRQALQSLGGALLILAPRHPQRFDEVERLLQATPLRYQRRSRLGDRADLDVLLLDTIGDLTDFYASADVAFVGGSLVPIGGHNLLEPAAHGLPVLSGPHNFAAPDVAAALQAAGGLTIVADGAALAGEVSRLLGDVGERQRRGAAALAVVEGNRGALAAAERWALDLLAAPGSP